MRTHHIIIFMLTAFTLDSCSSPESKSNDKAQQGSGAAVEILAIQSFPNATGYHLLAPAGDSTREKLQKFVDDYRKKNCSKGCNIYVYNDNSIKDLVTKYPLEDYEYLLVADHFLATSKFDSTDVKMYPFKDAKYKEIKEKK